MVNWLAVSKTLPLTFLLGFYVSLVVKRWWEQYVKMPWPDEVATLLKAGITKGKKGEEETQENFETRIGFENLRIRRTVVRYMLLSYVLCMRRISLKVRRDFPDMSSLVEIGLVRVDEVNNPYILSKMN